MQEQNIVIYQSENGTSKLEIKLENETLWLTQNEMAELFQTTKQNISLHIKNIYKEGELDRDATVKEFLTVQKEGKRSVERTVEHYNLDLIISVGYRIKSITATQFRIWATNILKEYIVKGFAMDDERLKQNGGGAYFDDLLARIRDIRSSEKVFWRKVLDIYATSADYDPRVKSSQEFFKTIQNKMHWAAHGHTAAEIIHQRADASLSNIGMTSFIGVKPTKSEAAIAKNYLTETELDMLNRIVMIYLEFAEIQAKNKKVMYMQDWIKKLDDFLSISDMELLNHKGSISHEQAIQKAEAEYEKYKQILINQKSAVEEHFEEAIKAIKTIEKSKK